MIDKIIDLHAEFEKLDVRVMAIEVSIDAYKVIKMESRPKGVSPHLYDAAEVLPKPGESPKQMGQLFGMDLYVFPEKATPAQKAAAEIRAEISKDFMDQHIHAALSKIADYLEKQ